MDCVHWTVSPGPHSHPTPKCFLSGILLVVRKITHRYGWRLEPSSSWLNLLMYFLNVILVDSKHLLFDASGLTTQVLNIPITSLPEWETCLESPMPPAPPRPRYILFYPTNHLVQYLLEFSLLFRFLLSGRASTCNKIQWLDSVSLHAFAWQVDKLNLMALSQRWAKPVEILWWPWRSF